MNHLLPMICAWLVPWPASAKANTSAAPMVRMCSFPMEQLPRDSFKTGEIPGIDRHFDTNWNTKVWASDLLRFSLRHGLVPKHPICI